ELKWDAEVLGLDGLNDGLEVVLLLSRDPELVSLNMRLDLDPGLLDQFHQIAGLLVGDAPIDVEGLPDGSTRGGLHRPIRERLQGQLAPHELLPQDLTGRLETILGARAHLDQIVIEGDRGVRSLEVEPSGNLANSLVDRVSNLLWVELRNDVEGELVLCHRRNLAVRPGS